MAALRVDIWSDVACPWCFIGKRRFERALASFGHEVAITWRAFELDPDAPRVRDDGATYAERIAAKYGTSPERAVEMIQRVVDAAAAEGIDMRFDRVHGGNSFDAHRLLHLAAERGIQTEVVERFFRGYFIEGMRIGDPDDLARMAIEAGLAEPDVGEVLATDRFALEVRQDESLARELGVTGVPFFVFAGNLAVSGAQPAEVLLEALERGWAEIDVHAAAASGAGGF